jgi:hypothetical protein
MSFAPARALQNLRSFIFRDHSLELHEQLVLGRRTARRADKQGLDAGAGELLDQENLVRVSSAQPVGRIDENGLDQSLGSKIAHPLEAGTDQARPTIAVVLEDPLLRHFELLFAGERNQRRRLAGDRVLLPLFVRRYTSVNRCGLHRLLPSPLRSPPPGPDQEPECRKPVQAWQRAADRMRTPDGWHAVSVAAQPCLRFAARKAATACLTTSLVVTPRAVA